MPFVWPWIEGYEEGSTPRTKQPDSREDRIADCRISTHVILDHGAGEKSPGRRMRVFSKLIHQAGTRYNAVIIDSKGRPDAPSIEFDFGEETPTYQQVYDACCARDEAREFLSSIELRRMVGENPPMIESIPEGYHWERHQRDPELHPALQDLATAITLDLTEACFAFDDPNLYYPGVDDGIEPVTDEHVELVMWATQRELKRELRPGKSGSLMTGPLPAVPLAELPFRIQRAFTERRRLRYQQWGIGRTEWETGRWSLWNVPEEPDWVPPWVVQP